VTRLEKAKAEREVMREDLRVCEEAYEKMREHVERRVAGPESETFFLSWSGTSAVTGALELSMQHLRDLF
jgi:4-aminobutyrate aminotransferase-like enzyme